jgi:hypothetical protein
MLNTSHPDRDSALRCGALHLLERFVRRRQLYFEEIGLCHLDTPPRIIKKVSLVASTRYGAVVLAIACEHRPDAFVPAHYTAILRLASRRVHTSHGNNLTNCHKHGRVIHAVHDALRREAKQCAGTNEPICQLSKLLGLRKRTSSWVCSWLACTTNFVAGCVSNSRHSAG